MATRIIENLSDDLDPRIKSNVETVTFKIDGVTYEIELGEQNRKHLENAMNKVRETYVSKARVVETAKPSKPAAKSDTEIAKIRVWAQANGYKVGDRGRIAAEIKDAYYKAQDATPDTDAQTSVDEPVSAVVESVPGEVESAPEIVELSEDFDTITNDEILSLMAEIDAEKGEVTLDDLAAKVDSKSGE